MARFVAAFESADVVGLVELLSDDAIFEMPPLPKWFAGIDTIRQFVATHVLHSGNSWRGIPTRANGQPAVATYLRDDDVGPHRAHGITVLTVRACGSAAWSRSSTPACSVPSACRRPTRARRDQFPLADWS